ncbi:MAG: S9 family peptidase [Gemmatimonadetes bacterium]|nr:S9 family peptidase [Gemmatimonadota bacterium]
MRLAAGCAVVAVLLVTPSLHAQAPSDRLTLNDYLEWESVQSPQLSPDGERIVFGRRWVDKLNDRFESSVWVMEADGSRPRALIIDGSSPLWSPDGSRIAYTASGQPSGQQIFVKYVDVDGPATQVTRTTESPSDLVWSLDGSALAFRMRVPANAGWKVEGQVSQFRPKDAKWTEAPRVVEKLSYRRDRVGFTADGYMHIFIVPADGGTPRQVTSGDFDHGAPSFTPDGRTLIFSGGPRTEDAEYAWRESDVYAVDIGTGVIRQLTTRSGPDNNPVVSPDGRMIAYTGYDMTTDTWVDSRLHVMNIDGTGSRVLTESLDRSPNPLEWAPDNSGIYFTVQDRGSQNLYFASTRGDVREVTRGAHMLSVTDISRNGIAVGTLSAPDLPGDIVTFDVRRPDAMRQITNVNADVLMGKRLGAVEEIWYTSADGLEIQGWIVKPPDFTAARKYPLMLSIHGGPHSMYNVGFNFGWQEHAANGYIVLYTNPRGSTGYGSAFGNAIKNAYPGKDYDDLMAGVDAVIATGYIDTDNMFVYGCSGGGVLTSWIVGQTDRFAAASANCPVTNWLSFVGTTDGATWYRNFERYPWEDPAEHLRRSPLMYVGNVKTPTMLMTGVNDLRTPMPQTEEYYQALKVLKVPTAMVRFNDEWHGTSSKPSNFIRTQLYLRDWFTKHSRPTATTTDATN